MKMHGRTTREDSTDYQHLVGQDSGGGGDDDYDDDDDDATYLDIMGILGLAVKKGTGTWNRAHGTWKMEGNGRERHRASTRLNSSGLGINSLAPVNSVDFSSVKAAVAASGSSLPRDPADPRASFPPNPSLLLLFLFFFFWVSFSLLFPSFILLTRCPMKWTFAVVCCGLQGSLRALHDRPFCLGSLSPWGVFSG